MRKRLRLQSAMEYLTTYGWAIAAIVVVLAVLFQLGIFNSSGNVTPKVPPGSCQIVRPLGPWTTYSIGEAGVCNNELPQYTMSTVSGNVFATDSGFPTGSNPISVFAWVRSSQNVCGPSIFHYGIGGVSGESWQLEDNNGQLCVTDGYPSANCANPLISNGNWYFVGFSYPGSGTSVSVYVGSNTYTVSLGGVPNIATSGANMTIGGTSDATCGGSATAFAGQLANVQIYNSSFVQGAVQNLYSGGIGATPVELQHLVGWYPLNGNANDYSGNLQNTYTSGVSYTGAWQNGYTGP